MNPIKKLIIKGLLKEVIIAERSLKLNESVNKSFNKIVNQNKKDIASILFDLSYTEMILALSRLFDEPSKKYPTRCLKSLYLITEEQELTSFVIKYRKESELHLSSFGFHQEFIDLLIKDSDNDFIKHSTAYFEAKEMNNPINQHILKLRNIRDKLIAHNEDTEIDSFVPYELLYELIEHAKNVLSFFSLTYTGVFLKTQTEFTTDHSSKKWQHIFNTFVMIKE